MYRCLVYVSLNGLECFYDNIDSFILNKFCLKFMDFCLLDCLEYCFIWILFYYNMLSVFGYVLFF